MADYNGEERRKNNNSLYLKFDLKKYLETDYLEKIKNALPCRVNDERIKNIENDNSKIWNWIYGIIFSVIIGGVVWGIFLK